MDFSTYTDDQLADIQKDLLDEAHARVEALEGGPVKNRADRALQLAHKALDLVKRELVDGEIIQPDSGGIPKEP